MRELSKTMRERFNTVVEYTTLRITKGDQAMHAEQDVDDPYDDRNMEALPRALACLALAVEDPGRTDRKVGELQSFKYIAAGVCLRELVRLRTKLGSIGPLPYA